MKKITCVNSSDFIEKVLLKITELAEISIKERDIFHIVLSGGETPVKIYENLRYIDTIWSKWHFWIADERMPSNEFSILNKNTIYDNLLQYLNVHKSQIHFISVELGMNDAIKKYNKELNYVNQFDLCLLGIGEDGHTASLFPGNQIGYEEEAQNVLAVTNSPKPPKQRITLSAKKLNKSNNVIYIVNGKSKSIIIDQIKALNYLPCNIVKGQQNTILYYCSS